MSDFGRKVSQAMRTFLETYGFRMISEGPSAVLFESDTCIFTVARDRHGSSELHFGLRSNLVETDCEYGVDEIFDVLGVPKHLQPPGYATKDEAGALKLLGNVGALLMQYGGELLRGDKATWAKLVAQTAADSEEYAIATNKRLALAAAETAWHEKNWQKYFDLLDGLRPHLGSADLAKLDYAARRMKPH